MRTGEHTDIEGVPVFSSNENRFAVARDATLSGLTGIDSVAVYRVTARKVIREFFEEMEHRSAEHLRWRGNAAISFVDVDWGSGKKRRRGLSGRNPVRTARLSGRSNRKRLRS
jgi:hypothetical protein